MKRIGKRLISQTEHKQIDRFSSFTLFCMGDISLFFWQVGREVWLFFFFSFSSFILRYGTSGLLSRVCRATTALTLGLREQTYTILERQMKPVRMMVRATLGSSTSAICHLFFLLLRFVVVFVFLSEKIDANLEIRRHAFVISLLSMHRWLCSQSSSSLPPLCQSI